MSEQSEGSRTRPGDTTPPSASRPPERRRRAVGWGTGDVLRAAALVILLYLLLRLIWFANALFLVVFLGVLFGLAVSAAVDRLTRWRIPRGAGAALVVLAFFGVLAGLGAMLAPTIRMQARELRQQLPQAIERIEGWIDERRQGTFGFLLRGVPGGQDTAVSPTQPAAPAPAGADTFPAGPDTAARRVPAQEPAPGISVSDRIGDQLGGVSRYLFRFVSSTVAVVSGILLVIFLSIYIAASPDTYHRGLLHLFPHDLRPRMSEVLHATATMLRKWLITQLIGMVVIGVVTTTVLLILDVQAAFALGLLAGLLEFVPTVGPVISAIPAVAMGFLDSPETALYVAIAYVGIQFLESNILIPMLMHEGLDIPPALSIVFQALMALLFGFLGLLVAVPMLAAVMVPIKMLYVEDVVGDEVTVPGESDDEDRPSEEGGDASKRPASAPAA